MCGICGVVGIGDSKEAEAVVRPMVAALRHRGPDDEGMLAVPHVALGIRRLSIIDLAGGHQPAFNEDRTVAVVFNGEIYNFQDLRRQLEAKGHVFRTHSDTESIVHAYEEWGEECVCRLRGMFAFALLDKRPKQGGGPCVFLARDRLGIKPLYYAFADGAILFASEVRALLASGCVTPHISQAALDSYLLFGSVAEPMTLIEGISSVPPGHWMSFPATRLARWPQPRAYWRYGEAARGEPECCARDLGTAASELRPLLEDVVRSYLVADVPLVVFLSSGMDSTALVAMASREQQGLHTFTVAFSEKPFSEASLARKTAERFRTRHDEI